MNEALLQVLLRDEEIEKEKEKENTVKLSKDLVESTDASNPPSGEVQIQTSMCLGVGESSKEHEVLANQTQICELEEVQADLKQKLEEALKKIEGLEKERNQFTE